MLLLFCIHFRWFNSRRIQQEWFFLPFQMRRFMIALYTRGCSPFGRLPRATNILPFQGVKKVSNCLIFKSSNYQIHLFSLSIPLPFSPSFLLSPPYRAEKNYSSVNADLHRDCRTKYILIPLSHWPMDYSDFWLSCVRKQEYWKAHRYNLRSR